jgi:hypothetical protein
MTTAIQTTNQSPSDMILKAVESGANLEQLKSLLDLQERWEATEARKAYNEAMTGFKANAPEIDKDRTVSYGTTKYTHASLANITKKVGAELSKWGLSASWKTAQNADSISVTCKIAHKKGHFEETTLSAKADTSGQKNAIQAIGSAITYLERYTLLALTGLATFDSDDDGVAAVTSFISQKELNQLIDMIAEKEVEIPKFLKYMGIESLDKMPKAKYTQAVEAIKAKVKAAK